MQSCAEMRHVRWVSCLYDDKTPQHALHFLDGDLSRLLFYPGPVVASQAIVFRVALLF